jgi:hypothetical protein
MRGDAGRERGLAGPETEAAGDVGAGKPAAALREEERVLARIGSESVATFVEVAAQGALRRLSDGQQPLLRALAEDP